MKKDEKKMMIPLKKKISARLQALSYHGRLKPEASAYHGTVKKIHL